MYRFVCQLVFYSFHSWVSSQGMKLLGQAGLLHLRETARLSSRASEPPFTFQLLFKKNFLEAETFLRSSPHPSPKPGNLFLDISKSVFGENHFLSTLSSERGDCSVSPPAGGRTHVPPLTPRPPMPCSSFLQGAVHLVSLNLSPLNLRSMKFFVLYTLSPWHSEGVWWLWVGITSHLEGGAVPKPQEARRTGRDPWEALTLSVD